MQPPFLCFMNCLFIYNPVSGKGKINKKTDYITATLKKKFDEVDVYATKCAGDMSVKAKEACGKYDCVVFYGGDGSFNEIVQGIAECETRPVLGYLPGGTVNDIAHSLKIPVKLKKSLKNVTEGVVDTYDLIKINDKYAFYVVCAGAFTGCSYMAEQSEKKKYGKVAYAFEVLKNELKLKDFNVTLDFGDNHIETNCEFLMALNSKHVASRYVYRQADLQDGKFDLFFIKQVKNPKGVHKLNAFFKVINYFVCGVKVCAHRFKRGWKSDYEHYCVDKVKLTVPDNVRWNLDGEKGMCGGVDISVLQRHVSVIVPKNKKKNKKK